MFSLGFSGSRFLINSRGQFRVRKSFSRWQLCIFRQFLRHLQSFFILCLNYLQIMRNLKLCVTYVLGCSFIKICSLKRGTHFMFNAIRALKKNVLPFCLHNIFIKCRVSNRKSSIWFYIDCPVQ